MRLTIKTSGGFANIELQAKVETAELEPSLAAKAERLLTRENLDRAHTAAVNPDAADAVLYQVTLDNDTEEGKEFRINDSSADPELSELLAAIVRSALSQRVQAHRKTKEDS